MHHETNGRGVTLCEEAIYHDDRQPPALGREEASDRRIQPRWDLTFSGAFLA